MRPRQFAHLDGHNAYDILGVDASATRAQIETARRGLVKVLHPDLPDGDAARMTLVNSAADILMDDDQRQVYDDYLAGTRRERSITRRSSARTRVPAGRDDDMAVRVRVRTGRVRGGASTASTPPPRPRARREPEPEPVATTLARPPLKWQPPPPGRIARWRAKRRYGRQIARGQRTSRSGGPVVVILFLVALITICAIGGALIGYSLQIGGGSSTPTTPARTTSPKSTATRPAATHKASPKPKHSH